MTMQSYQFRMWNTPGARGTRIPHAVMTGRDEAKEIRAFNLRDHLRARYDRLYDEYRSRTASSRANKRRRSAASATNQAAPPR